MKIVATQSTEHRRRLWTAYATAATMAFGVFGSSSADAYDLPTLNLGFTNFLDGGPPAGPGLYAMQYLQIYNANRLTDANGHSLALPATKLNTIATLTQFVYLPRYKIGPASFGLDVVIPVLAAARVDDGLNNSVLSARTGIGDVVIGPFIQFDPIMGPAGPRFVHRIEFQVNAPTGRYDPTAAVNPGSNFWSFDPYWAGTYWFSPKWSASYRLHYLWNGVNNNPNVAFQGASYTRAGEAIHANFATEYALTPQFRVGANGYWLQQTTDTTADGLSVPGRRERVVGIGPGLVYSPTAETSLFFNAYFETAARNRPEGQSYIMRFATHFD